MDYLSNMMLEALKFFAYFGGYGWGIVWLTIAVNVALYPLTLSSVKSMGALQKMQPKLSELQKKYKDKPQDLQKETMELYRREGVNPLGGCLPVLLKIPFFLALFWAFQSTAFMGIASDPRNNVGILWINGRISAQAFQSAALVKRLEQGSLLIAAQEVGERNNKELTWNAVLPTKSGKLLKDVLGTKSANNIDDIQAVRQELEEKTKGLSDEEARIIIKAWDATNNLARPERVATPFGGISILAILIGVTTYLMQASMPSGMSQQTQMMTIFMPIFITFICWNFPAGVQIYWLVSNAVGAAQQYYIMGKKK